MTRATPPSAYLEESLAGQLSHRREVWASLVGDRRFPRIYIALLIETYHYVKHSCALMRKACEHLPKLAHLPVAEYLSAHISEEEGHDRWLLEDLERLGVPRELATHSLPSEPAASMVGTQLFLMQEFCGISLLGYMFVLEAYPPKASALRSLSHRHAIPEDALSTFLHHSDVDRHHRRELFALVDSGWMQQADLELVAHSARSAAQQTCRLLEHIGSLFHTIATPQTHVTSEERETCPD